MPSQNLPRGGSSSSDPKHASERAFVRCSRRRLQCTNGPGAQVERSVLIQVTSFKSKFDKSQAKGKQNHKKAVLKRFWVSTGWRLSQKWSCPKLHLQGPVFGHQFRHEPYLLIHLDITINMGPNPTQDYLSTVIKAVISFPTYYFLIAAKHPCTASKSAKLAKNGEIICPCY